jgi:hypothetical protein
MKRHSKFNSIVVAAALCAVSAGSAVAQQASTVQPQTQQPTGTTNAPDPTQTVVKCRCWIGTTVENPQGQCLGKIDDVVVNLDNERGSYCVMSIKRGIFTKTRFLNVPLASFQRSADGSYLTLNANKANIARAGKLDRNEGPSGFPAAWGAEPAAPEQLPAVVVVAPAGGLPSAPVGPAYPWVADPAMGPARLYQAESASHAIDGLRFQVTAGYQLMSK